MIISLPSKNLFWDNLTYSKEQLKCLCYIHYFLDNYRFLLQTSV